MNLQKTTVESCNKPLDTSVNRTLSQNLLEVVQISMSPAVIEWGSKLVMYDLVPFSLVWLDRIFVVHLWGAATNAWIYL